MTWTRTGEGPANSLASRGQCSVKWLHPSVPKPRPLGLCPTSHTSFFLPSCALQGRPPLLDLVFLFSMLLFLQPVHRFHILNGKVAPLTQQTIPASLGSLFSLNLVTCSSLNESQYPGVSALLTGWTTVTCPSLKSAPNQITWPESEQGVVPQRKTRVLL